MRSPRDADTPRSFARARRAVLALAAVAGLAVGAAACGDGDASSPPATTAPATRGDATSPPPATTAAAGLGPVATVRAYLQRFADGDMGAAADLMPESMIAECGGRDGILDALRRARADQDVPLLLADGRFDGRFPPRVMATLYAAGHPDSAAGGIPMHVAREGGAWRMGMYFPNELSFHCAQTPRASEGATAGPARPVLR